MIVVRTLRQATGAYPTQWEGETTDDREVYVRFRHARLTIWVGTQPRQDPLDGEVVFNAHLDPPPLDGWLEYERLQFVTKGLVQWPATLSE